MYVIYADGKPIYSPNIANEGYAVINPKLTLELNKAGSLTFLLPPNNVMYDSIQKLKTIITVKDGNEEIFRGRVLHDEKDFYNRKDIYCEGELSFLLDSVTRPYTFQGSINNLFKKFVNDHNTQVDEDKQFKVGIITVTDSNDYINRENSDYSNTLDQLNDKLIGTHGGYLRPRLQNGVKYLDYVVQYGVQNTQVIEFEKNMLDISEYISADEVFTVLIPLGAEQQDKDGNSTGRLTVASVNDGKDYIESPTGISLFGKIWKVEKWDDITIPSNLVKKGRTFLHNGIEMAVSLKMKAVDLHLIDVNTERIKLGDFIRVVSVPHNLDKYFLCSKIVIDMVSPDNTEFSLGVTFKALTEKQVNSSKVAQNTMSSVQTAIQSTRQATNQANNAVEQIETIITQVEGDFVKTETFEEYQKDINSRLSSVYRIKGSVANYDALPVTNKVNGDVYNLLDTGANYAWTDEGWDKLSETIDLSGYVEKKELPTKVSDLEDDIGIITEHQDLSGYVEKTTFEELLARVERLEGSGE